MRGWSPEILLEHAGRHTWVPCWGPMVVRYASRSKAIDAINRYRNGPQPQVRDMTGGEIKVPTEVYKFRVKWRNR